ncbi:MAG TPA: MBOAT family protein [Vicinamibacterales bacterium]|nr:MBOAT family protein [Vicinamibacterales bacterium]
MFFPLVCLAYFATPHRLRWITLLIASCIFYMAFIPAYILVLFGLIVVDYTAGIVIERSSGARRKALLVASLTSNIGILAVFKYYNFAVMSAAGVFGSTAGAHLPLLSWALPLGLSFHTFQSMAYTVEVYRGRYPAERHLGRYALYVMFFPQLVAGPIERPAHLLPQFLTRHRFDPDRAASGLKLIAWGLVKKVVIADRLAGAVDTVYTLPTAHHGPAIIVATIFFGVQIYCDFSGYTDIAIGSAEVLGFSLVTNFRRPYLARSVGEFWSRWHISLSTWFRDYLYIPLGGNRVPRRRWMLNILLTFLISGLWHGANWTFVVWGALHGCYLVLGRLSAPLRDRARALVEQTALSSIVPAAQTAITFALVTLAWVFFRARSVRDGFVLVSRATDWSVFDLDALGLTRGELTVSVGLIAALFAIEALSPDDDARSVLRGAPIWMRWSAYYGVMATLLLLGVYNNSKFIYFQF